MISLIECIALGSSALSLGLAIAERIRSRKQSAVWQDTATNALKAFTSNGVALNGVVEGNRAIDAKVMTLDARMASVVHEWETINEGQRKVAAMLQEALAPKKRGPKTKEEVGTNG